MSFTNIHQHITITVFSLNIFTGKPWGFLAAWSHHREFELDQGGARERLENEDGVTNYVYVNI